MLDTVRRTDAVTLSLNRPCSCLAAMATYLWLQQQSLQSHPQTLNPLGCQSLHCCCQSRRSLQSCQTGLVCCRLLLHHPSPHLLHLHLQACLLLLRCLLAAWLLLLPAGSNITAETEEQKRHPQAQGTGCETTAEPCILHQV
jgi:hypothetical protein